MSHWTLEDIPWDAFDPSRIDPDLVSVIKAASLVERNSADYACYLQNVFPEDTQFCRAAEVWAEEEIQHGEALGRWAEMADPDFDFRDSLKRFTTGFRIPVESMRSVRGSRSGELIARCIVETGTSSFYSAIRDAAQEPVIKAICGRIAGDEFRHYKLFYTTMQRYLVIEKPNRMRRALVAFHRYRESDDDELAYAYYCANICGAPYDRRICKEAYAARAFSFYRRIHVDRATAMALRAAGLDAKSRLHAIVGSIIWRHLRSRARLVQPA